MRYLICYITHNFNEIFLSSIKRLDKSLCNQSIIDCIILFDKSKEYEKKIKNELNNIKIIEIDIIDISYDNTVKGGHTMYINYFITNIDKIEVYDYIWIVENDVYHKEIEIFIRKYDDHEYDLLVPEYGLRSNEWHWFTTLEGFKREDIGILGVIMRWSKRLLKEIIKNIDKEYKGFFEVLLPHVCINRGYNISEYYIEDIGIITIDNNNELIKLIRLDILNRTENYIENKLYHPIK